MKDRSSGLDDVGADRLLELEDQPGPDRLDDRRGAALLALHRVVEVAVLGRVDVGDGAAAEDRRDPVAEQLPPDHQHARGAGAADELVRARGRPRPCRPADRRRRSVHVDLDVRRRRRRSPRTTGRRGGAAGRRSPVVSETMPVTLEAAEKLPMRSGRPAWPTSSSLELAEVDVAVGVLADHHHLGDRLAPRQLVGVVLVRPDEHHRPLAGRDRSDEPVAVVQVGRDAQVEDADELVDGGGARPTRRTSPPCRRRRRRRRG